MIRKSGKHTEANIGHLFVAKIVSSYKHINYIQRSRVILLNILR